MLVPDRVTRRSETHSGVIILGHHVDMYKYSKVWWRLDCDDPVYHNNISSPFHLGDSLDSGL